MNGTALVGAGFAIGGLVAVMGLIAYLFWPDKHRADFEAWQEELDFDPEVCSNPYCTCHVEDNFGRDW